MTEKHYYSPGEAVAYLNEKFNLQPPHDLNLARLARLRRKNRIEGERIGNTKTSVYTRKSLDRVTLHDIEDWRKKPVS